MNEKIFLVILLLRLSDVLSFEFEWGIDVIINCYNDLDT